MNKILLISIITQLLLFVSCKNNSSSPKSKIDSIQEANKTSLAQENYQSEDFAEIGFELTSKEGFGQLKIGIDSIDLINLFGRPDSISSEQLWGADGSYHSDWIYSKKGMTFGMSRIEEDPNQKHQSKLVDRISIYSPCNLKTKRGIGLNSSISEVKQAYKKAIENTDLNNDYLIAGSVYGGLMFKFKNNLVEEIFLGAMAE